MPGIRARPLTRAATAPAVAAVMALWGLAVTLGAAQSGAQEPPGKDVCLACHGDPGAVSSAGRSVAVDEARFGGSVHGFLGMACIDCHTDVAAAQEFPHAERLAPVQCGLCHDAPVAAYDRSVHARARRERVSSVAATCVDCHTTHDIRPASDPDSPTYALNVPATCARCHGSAEVIAAGGISIGNVPALYEDSIHGRAVSRAGLLVAPTCTSCHDSHDIREKSDVESRVHHANVPATCGRCHEGILRVYGEGVHGSGLASGNGSVPVCSDCHSAHGIQRAEVSGWQLDVIGECGTCHACGHVRGLPRVARHLPEGRPPVHDLVRATAPDVPAVPRHRHGGLHAVRPARRQARREAEPDALLGARRHDLAARRHVRLLRPARDALAAAWLHRQAKEGARADHRHTAG
jgi:hypothetical protein